MVFPTMESHRQNSWGNKIELNYRRLNPSHMLRGLFIIKNRIKRKKRYTTHIVYLFLGIGIEIP